MIQALLSPSARERLDFAADFLAQLPPGTEALVVAPSRDMADDFVRDLAVQGGATFGWHRVSLSQLVTILASPQLASAGSAPSTLLGMEAVATRAAFACRAQEELAELAAVAEFPGFARSLASTLQDLRQSDVSQDDLAGDRVRDLARLMKSFEASLTDLGIADRNQLLELATQAIRDGASPYSKAALVVLDCGIETRREREFARALVEDAAECRITVPGGDARTIQSFRAMSQVEWSSRPSPSRSSLSQLQNGLFSEEDEQVDDLDDAVRFFSAPGEGRECVEIARAVLDEARRGVPFDEMAVFLRAPEIYSAHLETAFRRAQIPAFWSRGTKRPDPSGRAFLALLACKAEDLSANRFAEYLSFAQVPTPEETGGPPLSRETWVPPEDDALGPVGAPVQLSLFAAPTSPPAPDHDDSPELEGTLRAPWRWEAFLVEAAVIGGKDRWRRRLRGFENELGIQIERLRAEEPESTRLPALEKSLGNLRHLEKFALPVVERLDHLPREARWSEWMQRLSELAPQVLRKPEHVLSILAELAPMGEVGPVTIGEVRAVLTERLTTLERERPEHRFGRVFVATPDQARARSFRVVFVPGLAERVFPQRPREDPLLLDDERERLSADLPTQQDRGQSERLRLHLVAGASEESLVFSYSRLDVAEARPRVPSFYALDVARATRGELPDYEQLEREASERVQARLAWPAPQDPERAVDDVEHDLAVLGALLHVDRDESTEGRARYLLELNPHLGRSLRSRYVRWRFRKWAPEDGLVRSTEHTEAILQAMRPNRRAYSVTALQRFAACPHQFLMAAMHRLEPREEAAPLIQMDPLTRGSMIHEIQARTLRTLKESDSLPITSRRIKKALSVLSSELSSVAAKYREDLAPAILRVWEEEVERVWADLRVWIHRLSDESKEWVPKHFEYTFGLAPDPSYDPESQRDPVTFPGGWKLRGAIDMIEERVDGSKLRVTDHKTGMNRTTEGWVVGGGETLQPVLYSLAVEAALDREVEVARLSFCTSRGGFTERSVAMNEWARMYGRRVVEIIDRAVERGTLPPLPKKDACRFCDFRSVCGPHEELRSKRKVQPLVSDLESLREMP